MIQYRQTLHGEITITIQVMTQQHSGDNDVVVDCNCSNVIKGNDVLDCSTMMPMHLNHDIATLHCDAPPAFQWRICAWILFAYTIGLQWS